MKLVPPLPGEEAPYGWIRSVFKAAAKDPATKQALVESFVAADKELIAPLTQWKLNGRSAGNGLNSPVNNAKWGTDYLNRTATSKSNMYNNTPEETKYIYRDFDGQGQQLQGKELYTVTFPKGQQPPVKGFWSLTLYFGAKSPGKDKESNWVPAPDGTFSLYLRCYWSDRSILDGSWMPPQVELVK